MQTEMFQFHLHQLSCLGKLHVRQSYHDPYIYIYIYREREREREQDLGIVLRCCSLSSPFEIQPCDFFLIGWKCIF